jgi:hypothetical protein
VITRTQISLDTEMQRLARLRAAERGVSLAEYLRGLIARDLAKPPARKPPSCIFGLGSSGGADVARDEDQMLGEAVASRRRRRET